MHQDLNLTVQNDLRANAHVALVIAVHLTETLVNDAALILANLTKASATAPHLAKNHMHETASVTKAKPAATTTVTKAEATPHVVLPTQMQAAAHHAVHAILLKNILATDEHR